MYQEKGHLTFKEKLILQKPKDFLQDHIIYTNGELRKAKWATLFSSTLKQQVGCHNLNRRVITKY